MKGLNYLFRMIAMSCAAAALAGCVAYPAGQRESYPPPPRAPAAGYHQEYRGHDLRWNASLGVYVIMDLPNHYFYNGDYYRYHRGQWYYSRDMKKRWRHYDERKLPPGLAKKYPREKKEKR